MLLDRVIGENIKIQTDFQRDIWKIWADEGNIEQVIMNLAVNSRDAMPQGGVIKIRTQNRKKNSGQICMFFMNIL